MRTRLALITAALVAAGTLSACSSATSAEAPPTASSAGGPGTAAQSTAPADAKSGDTGSTPSAGGSGDLTTVTVADIPDSSHAPLYLGMKKGIFAKHGLKLDVRPAAAGATVVASLVSGAYDFGFTSVPGLIKARANGTKIKCVAPIDGGNPTDSANNRSGIVVKGDSDIKSVKDLAGKRMGVVALTSNFALQTKVVAKAAGIDPDSIKFVQVPLPQEPEALKSGQIDAAFLLEPFVTTALNNGARYIAKPGSELLPGVSTVCFGATDDYIAKNPKLVEAFSLASSESISYAKEHQDEAKEILPSFLQIPAAAAAKTIFNTDWNPKLDGPGIEKMESWLIEFNELKSKIPVSDLVWQGAL